MPRRRCTLATALVLQLAVLRHPAHAALVSATTGYGEIPGHTDSAQSSTAPYNLRAFVSDSVFDGSAATAEATVKSVPAGFLGLLSKVAMHVRATGSSGDSIGSRAGANAMWSDTIHWLNPEIVFDPALIRFIFSPTVRGNLSGPRAEMTFIYTVGPAENEIHEVRGSRFTFTNNVVVDGTLLSNLGMTISMDITVGGGADPHEQPSTADFSHTTWLPAIEMVDLAGNPVPGGDSAVLMGDSGIQYAMWSSSLTYAADFDEDVDVDADDLDLWSASYGLAAGASHAQGDAQQSRTVDGADFLAWQREAGSVSSPMRSVPEPTAAVLVISALLGLTNVMRSRSTDDAAVN